MALTDADRIQLTGTLRGQPERGGEWRPIAWAGDVVEVVGVTRSRGPFGRETDALVVLRGERYWVNVNECPGDPV